ncbi:MAG: metallophosphoesterase [Actinomycetota bacterium]|nr:metallophosphoesterase [Actinomycetota bacterium]
MGLLSTGYKVLLAGIFGQYSDKRETMAALPQPPFPPLTGEEIWIDYVSDAGDGWDSTYTVAWLLGREALEVHDGAGPRRIERGRILVMGGDQVYPTPNEDAYQGRLIGPYRAALPWTEPGSSPVLFAIPGNHDWYDGLSTFLRLFHAGKWVGGWRVDQSRSYFAIELPHQWWLWGIDVQLDFRIDQPQLDYFHDVAANHAKPGDRLILCTAKPAWVHDTLVGDVSFQANERAKRNLVYFESDVVRAHGLDLRLVLSGDLHHYARYEGTDGSHRITSGGGGAFLYPTHNLPEHLSWPMSSGPGAEEIPYRRAEQGVFPDVRRSERLRWGAFVAPVRTWTFMILNGLLYMAFAWMIRFALPLGQPFVVAMKGAGFRGLGLAMLRNPMSLLLALLLLLALWSFADGRKWWGRLSMAGPHWLAHMAMVTTVVWGATRVPFPPHPYSVLPFVLLVGIVGGFAGAVLMGGYLLTAQLAVKRHPNEAFSAQHIDDYKNFLRMHIDRSGVLTVYPVGVERACRDWRPVTPDHPQDPWVEPASGSIPYFLIEGPIHLP